MALQDNSEFPVYRRAHMPTDARVADLLARMTIDEKIAQMHAFWLLLSENGDHRTRSDSFTGASDQARSVHEYSRVSSDRIQASAATTAAITAQTTPGFTSRG